MEEVVDLFASFLLQFGIFMFSYQFGVLKLSINLSEQCVSLLQLCSTLDDSGVRRSCEAGQQTIGEVLLIVEPPHVNVYFESSRGPAFSAVFELGDVDLTSPAILIRDAR